MYITRKYELLTNMFRVMNDDEVTSDERSLCVMLWTQLGRGKKLAALQQKRRYVALNQSE